MSTHNRTEMTLNERDWLAKLLTAPGRVDITDKGFDFTDNRGEIVYEVPYGRFEVTIRVLDMFTVEHSKRTGG